FEYANRDRTRRQCHDIERRRRRSRIGGPHGRRRRPGGSPCGVRGAGSTDQFTRQKGKSMPEAITVRKVPLHSVADASELGKLIDDGVMEADRVIAIIGKTEGNGGVNDYTRIIADRAFREVIEEK